MIAHLNTFSTAMLERSRLLKSFSRFVAADVAEKALGGELRGGEGELREMTVMMSDIRDFTGLSEKMEPARIVELLNDYFARMLEVFARHNVVVDKYVGDGILAYVELPAGAGAKAENRCAVSAARAMLDAVSQFSEERTQRGEPAIRIGIGITRGPVVVGLIGSPSRLQHTIIGDTVNRAARFEGLCRPLGVPVVVSETVYRSLPPGENAGFREFPPVEVKGLAQPVTVYGGPVIPA